MDDINIPPDIQPATPLEDLDNPPPPPDAVEDAPDTAADEAGASAERIFRPLGDTAEAIRSNIAAFPVLSVLLAGVAGFGASLLVARMRRA